MGKGTNKKIIHGIFIASTVIFALVTSFYVAIRDTTVQSMIARTVAGILSKKLNTEVHIKTFYITPRLLIHAEDVYVNDLQHYNLLKIGELESSFSWRKDSRMFYVKDIKLRDFYINIVKYEGFDNLNVKDLLNELTLKKDKSADKDLDMQFFINDIELRNGRVVYWNQNKDNPEKQSMDYLHLDVRDIYLKASDLSFKSDTVRANIVSLCALEKCGFDIYDFKGDILVCPTETSVQDLKLQAHDTDVSMDLSFKYNDYADYLTFVDSVYITADIDTSILTLTDIKYFSNVMAQMPDTLRVEGLCEGYVRDFKADDFNFSFGENTSFNGDVTFRGLPDFFTTYMTADIRELTFSYDDLIGFSVPYLGNLPIPDIISSMTNGSLTGYFNGTPADFNTSLKINTVKGDVDVECSLDRSNVVSVPEYHVSMLLDDFDVTEMLSLQHPLIVDMNMNLGGSGFDKKTADLELVVNIDSLFFMNNEFNDIHLSGDFENQKLIALADIKSPIIDVNFSGLLNLQYEEPALDVSVDIENMDLYKLNILHNDSIMSLSAKVSCNTIGRDFKTVVGELNIDSLSYLCSSGTYEMDTFTVDISNDDYMLRNINVLCDFFDIKLSGIFDPYTIDNAFKNYVLNYLYVPAWNTKGETLDSGKQDFSLYLHLKDTKPLTALFMPSLEITDGSTLRLSFLSDDNRLSSTFISDEIIFGGLRFENVNIFNRSDDIKTYAEVNFRDMILHDSTEKNSYVLGLENFKMRADLKNDSVFFNMKWDNMNGTDKGLISALYVIEDKHHSRLSINSSDILVNNRNLAVDDSCFVDFFNDKIYINKLYVYEGEQFVGIDGLYPKRVSDTLQVTFNDFDISTFDLLTEGYNIDFDGFINGALNITGIYDKPTFLSDLKIKDVFLNEKEVGNINLMANWDAKKSSVYVDSSIENNNNEKLIDLTGNYYPFKNTDNLKFNLFINNFDVNVISPFVSSIVSDVKGSINGVLSLSGTFSELVFDGGLGFNNAGCKINYLNNYYTFSHVINLSRNLIDIENMTFTDVNNNTAVANGTITHDYLKNFVFDINIDCHNFFALNIPEDKANGFYGTAVADGVVGIKGPLNDIKLDVTATTKKGTEIDIPITNTNVVNDDFIVFVQEVKQIDTVASDVYEPLQKTDFTMNLNADVNTDAKVRISLPMNIGVITANGNGNLRMGYKSGDLSLIGDYIISEGEFVFTIQNLIKMDFALRGGTISWTGDVSDADIDVVGSYRATPSMSSLGSWSDSTSVGEKVNVDCIIRLRDKLMNPTITFGLDLPNANDDIKNTVFSMVDTTNQAAVAQQVFSLLVLGSFTYSSSDAVSQIGATTYYNVLTNQLSNWLSQISKDLDIGVRYTPESDFNKEEFKVALSTKFFDDRLTIEGNFGMITESGSANYTNNVVGDVDITWRITKRLNFKVYNHSNTNSNYYSYSFENYSDYTQGIGLSYSQSFDKVSEIFTRRKRSKDKKNKN